MKKKMDTHVHLVIDEVTQKWIREYAEAMTEGNQSQAVRALVHIGYGTWDGWNVSKLASKMVGSEE